MIDKLGSNLSVVVQGGINRDNIVNVAHMCSLWRDLFPRSEIICVVSTSDILEIDTSGNLTYKNHNSLEVEAHAYNAILHYVDNVLCNGKSISIPFPAHASPNPVLTFNANLMIECAKIGLQAASRRYCLRVRNDAFFTDDNFIESYTKMCRESRSNETSVLKQRILKPWLFTLNPYTTTRLDANLPYQVSDWMDFGLLEDVKTLWVDVPPITYMDATYFRYVHPEKMGDLSIRHFVRFNVEQHICRSLFKKIFPNLHFEYSSDCQTAELSMNVMLDNFAIFSAEYFHFHILKQDYEKLLRDGIKVPEIRSTFITQEAWSFMVRHRNIPFERVLKGDVDKNIKNLAEG